MDQGRPPSGAKRKTRRGYASHPARDPHDLGTWDILISHRRLDFIGKVGGALLYETARLVPHVLRQPIAIFEGIRRDEDDDRHEGGTGWLCYIGRPPCAYAADGSRIPSYSGETYLVFVNDERVAYNWRWEKCGDNPDLPEGYGERFRERLL